MKIFPMSGEPRIKLALGNSLSKRLKRGWKDYFMQKRVEFLRWKEHETKDEMKIGLNFNQAKNLFLFFELALNERSDPGDRGFWDVAQEDCIQPRNVRHIFPKDAFSWFSSIHQKSFMSSRTASYLLKRFILRIFWRFWSKIFFETQKKGTRKKKNSFKIDFYSS